MTVDAILDAVARLLVDSGYAKATTNHIAERAGVSIGTLYQYFPTKDAVIAALVERHIDRVRAVLVQRLVEVHGAPIAAFVPAMIRAVFDAHAVDPGLHRVMLEQIPRVERGGRLLALQREMEAGVAAALGARASSIRRDRVELAAVVAVQAVTAAAHAALFDDALWGARDGLVDEVTDLLVRYLAR